jgi:hypothetical protein
MSILSIFIILYYNSKTLSISSALILPFSINKISYLNDYRDLGITWAIEQEYEIETFIYPLKIDKMSKFLNDLDNNSNYIGIIEFVPDLNIWLIDAPNMVLSKPFLINKNSSATTITKFINERIDLMVEKFYLDDTITQDNASFVGLSFSKIYLI